MRWCMGNKEGELGVKPESEKRSRNDSDGEEGLMQQKREYVTDRWKAIEEPLGSRRLPGIE